MSITGLPVAYANVAYADLINLATPWTTATTTAKENSLQWGRVYIEKTYRVLFDQDDPSDAVKTANSMLANEDLTTALFDAASSGDPAKGLKSTKVKAGSAESSKEWDTNKSNSWVDQYPEITALLALDGLCPIAKGGVQYSPLLRR